jgi:hypothetical protein
MTHAAQRLNAKRTERAIKRAKRQTKTKNLTVQLALMLLNEAEEFFGPCWCNKRIGYRCPQCDWRVKYEKFKKVAK